MLRLNISLACLMHKFKLIVFLFLPKTFDENWKVWIPDSIQQEFVFLIDICII